MRIAAGAAATLLALATHRRACSPALQLSDSTWFFTAVRGGGGDVREVTLPAMAVPLATPLWVGEVREIQLRSSLKAAQPLLASLRGNETFVFLTAAARDSLAGLVVTEARLHRAQWMAGSTIIESAQIVGVSRYRVSALAGERPYLMLRGLRICDDDDDVGGGTAGLLAKLEDAKERAEATWAEAATLAKRIQAARLKSTLSGLGGSASAALLAIPEADQISLRKAAAASDGAGRGGGPSTSGRPALEEMLESGVSLAEELEAAGTALGLPRQSAAGGAEGESSDGGQAERAAEYRAMIERVARRHGLLENDEAAWTLDESTLASQAKALDSLKPTGERSPDAEAVTEYEAARLALLSHVAVRLAAGGEEEQRVWAEKSRSGLARWERAVSLLGAKRDELRTIAMMTAAAVEPTGGEEEEGGSA